MESSLFIFFVLFAVLIGIWAESWGRRGWAWGLVSLFIPPLIVAIVLLFCGKAKQA